MSSGNSGKDEDYVEYFRDELPNPTFVPDEMREQAQASEEAYYAQHGAQHGGAEGEQGEEGGEGWYSVPLEGAIYQPPEIAKGPPEEAPQHVARLGGGGGGGGGSGGSYGGEAPSMSAPAYGAGSAPMSDGGGGRSAGGRRGRSSAASQGGQGHAGQGGGGGGGGPSPSFSSPSELAQTLGMPPSPADEQDWDPLMPQRPQLSEPDYGAENYGAENHGAEDWASSPMAPSYAAQNPSSRAGASADSSSFPFPPSTPDQAGAMDPFAEHANESFASNRFNPFDSADTSPFDEENNSIPRLPPLTPAALAPDSIPEDPFMPRAPSPAFQEDVPFTQSVGVPSMRPSLGIGMGIGASLPGLSRHSRGGLLGSSDLTQIASKKKKRAKKVF